MKTDSPRTVNGYFISHSQTNPQELADIFHQMGFLLFLYVIANIFKNNLISHFVASIALALAIYSCYHILTFVPIIPVELPSEQRILAVTIKNAGCYPGIFAGLVVHQISGAISLIMKHNEKRRSRRYRD